MITKSVRDYDKIGGWLILVAIGLAATVVRMLVSLVKDYAPLFSNGTWSLLVSGQGVPNGLAVAVLIVFEILGNIGFAAFAVFLLFELRDKKTSFPQNARLFYLSNLAFVAVDFVVYLLLFPNNDESPSSTLYQLVGAVITTAIWVPYFYRSERVKQTFRVRESFGSDALVSETPPPQKEDPNLPS